MAENTEHPLFRDGKTIPKCIDWCAEKLHRPLQNCRRYELTTQALFDLAISAVGVLTVIFYTWALRTHFSSKTIPRGTFIISVTVSAVTLWYLALTWWLEPPLAAMLIGLLLQLASFVLFWSAIRASRKARLRLAFDLENPDTLVREGPYQFVRHPFYTSYIIFWAAWALAIWSLWALPPLAFIVTIYVVAAKDEERKFSRTAMANDYADYSAKTGFLWPRLLRATPDRGN